MFQTNAHDFIERDAGGPFSNHEEYRFRGAEATVRTSRIHGLDLGAGYSFLDSDDVAAGLPLQTRPRHRVSVEWVWTPVAGSAVRGALLHSGTQLYDSRGASPVQREADGFTLVDAGFTQAIARRCELAFEVTNLLDRLYDQAYALPREGRAALLTLRLRMK